MILWLISFKIKKTILTKVAKTNFKTISIPKIRKINGINEFSITLKVKSRYVHKNDIEKLNARNLNFIFKLYN